jgi:hypothetical protein
MGRKEMSNKDKRNGAFCNKLGEIYLRIASLDTEAPDWPMRVVDHGISLAEAHCIMSELVLAIHEASMYASGRIPEINKEETNREEAK